MIYKVARIINKNKQYFKGPSYFSAYSLSNRKEDQLRAFFDKFYTTDPNKAKEWKNLRSLNRFIDGANLSCASLSAQLLENAFVEQYQLKNMGDFPVGNIKQILDEYELSEDAFFEAKSGGGTTTSVPGNNKAKDNKAKGN